MSEQVMMPLPIWWTIPPEMQGFVWYLQSGLPGSRLPEKNPYPVGSPQFEQFTTGIVRAINANQQG